MVVIRNDEGKGSWNGVLVDGYLPKKERLEFLYNRGLKSADSTLEDDPKEFTIDDLFYHLLIDGQRSYCRKLFREDPTLAVYRRGKKYRKSICEHFTFDNEEKNQIQSPLGHLLQEFEFDGHWNDYRIIVLMEKECPKPEACIESALEKIEFTIKQPDQYKDYEKFKEVADEILENASCHFNAPCITFSDNMVRFGLTVYY